MTLRSRWFLPLLSTGLTLATLQADEGMWLYSNPPRKQLEERHGFKVTDAWLQHLMQSSVRFNSGGSGSFVSEDGLVLSNHHVGADAIQKLSTPEKDYMRDGFHARRLQDEIRCVDLELNVLQSIEDVTARVAAAVPKDASAEAAALARRKVIAEVEKESQDRTGLRSNVITLFQGGAYHLYRFKRYTDVRLVFAPEKQAAFFGGDPDNFEFPRYDLDFCLMRVYEDGKPAKVPHHLTWSRNGTKEGDLTFVSGHPGRTSRLLTQVELEYLRDVQFPATLDRLKRLEVLLQSWSARSPENARRAADELFGFQNSRKARDGGMAGLLDPVLMGRKAEAERQFRQRLRSNGSFPDAEAAYDRIADAQREIGRIAPRYRLIEGGQAFNCDTFDIAKTLLRSGDERSKPNGERLPEFSESRKPSLEMDLFSDKPIHEDLEILKLTESLTYLANELGFKDPTVQTILGGKSPQARAAQLIQGSQLRDVATRKKLYEGGADTVRAAKDPLVELARQIDAEARELRRKIEAQGELKQQAQAAIAKARFALDGATSYPDATFTLRLAYGTVQGYTESGKPVAPFTTFAGLYERDALMKNQPPFDLPQRWFKRKSALDLKTPYNFVNTADIIGGNSGSPVVNRDGELVGLIFDGNIQSLVLDFAYDDVMARALSVDSRAILEALDTVYGAREIVRELQSGKRLARGQL